VLMRSRVSQVAELGGDDAIVGHSSPQRKIARERIHAVNRGDGNTGIEIRQVAADELGDECRLFGWKALLADFVASADPARRAACVLTIARIAAAAASGALDQPRAGGKCAEGKVKCRLGPSPRRTSSTMFPLPLRNGHFVPCHWPEAVDFALLEGFCGVEAEMTPALAPRTPRYECRPAAVVAALSRASKAHFDPVRRRSCVL